MAVADYRGNFGREKVNMLEDVANYNLELNLDFVFKDSQLSPVTFYI